MFHRHRGELGGWPSTHVPSSILLPAQLTLQQKRHATPGYTACRVFGELSPIMTAALRRSIVSKIKTSTTPGLESALRSLDIYSSGYLSTEAPSMYPVILEETKSWATRPTDDPETISIRSDALAAIHYGQGKDPTTVLTPEAECEVILSGLCLDLYGFEKRSGRHALNDSFRQLLDEMVGLFLEEAQLRILRLWHSAYRLAVVANSIHWSRNILHSRPSSDPQYDPNWNRIAQAIRRDDVRVFRQLLEKKALPEQISLDTTKGTQNLMMLVIEQHLPNILAISSSKGPSISINRSSSAIRRCCLSSLPVTRVMWTLRPLCLAWAQTHARFSNSGL